MSQFVYLLNAMELASQASNPAEHGYAIKRRAVLKYVEELEAPAATSPVPAMLDALFDAYVLLPMTERNKELNDRIKVLLKQHGRSI